MKCVKTWSNKNKEEARNWVLSNVNKFWDCYYRKSFWPPLCEAPFKPSNAKFITFLLHPCRMPWRKCQSPWRSVAALGTDRDWTPGGACVPRRFSPKSVWRCTASPKLSDWICAPIHFSGTWHSLLHIPAKRQAQQDFHKAALTRLPHNKDCDRSRLCAICSKFYAYCIKTFI